MSDSPNAAQGTPKTPASLTSLDSQAVTVGPEPLDAPSKPMDQQPSEIAEIKGKVIRKDSAAGGVTRPLAQETVATQPPEESAMAAQKSSDSGEMAAPAGEKGATILGDYKLIKKLGQGGMGAVYKAHQLSLDRVVAIKVLAKELAGKDAHVKRFQREARVMVKLDHPNILRCFDVGQAKGFHYLTMEFVEGGSVETWLRKLGKFSVGDALHIILKTAAALEHAHSQNTIHRDVKPDNILLTRAGVVKVADMGLAKDTSEDTSLTKTGAGAGTPLYMAPEQARDVKHVDSRVDIYALGVMLYVFLTGRPPFEGATLVDLVTAKEKGKFEPIRRHNDDVPSKIDLIVDKMLAKDPKQRYATCQEVIDELAPLGLANEELSFLGNEQEKTVAPGGKAGKTQGPTPKVAKTSGPGAKAAATSGPKPAAKMTPITSADVAPGDDTLTADEAPEAEHDIWYWRLVTQEGRKITKKVTTDQLRTLIKSGHLDPTAEISRFEKSGFRPAATYTEFQPYFKARDASTKANVKGHKYKNKMEELVAEDDRRRKYGWINRMFKGVGGILFGLLWIAIILAIVGAAGYFGWKYLNP